MTRKSKRDTIKTTLEALSLFTAVYKGARRKFQGLSPVATVLSRSKLDHWETRGATVADYETFGYTVSLFVRVDDGVEETGEDILDDLRDAVGNALFSAGFQLEESDAEPMGFVLRNIDGVFYRVERMPVSIEEFT